MCTTARRKGERARLCRASRVRPERGNRLYYSLVAVFSGGALARSTEHNLSSSVGQGRSGLRGQNVAMSAETYTTDRQREREGYSRTDRQSDRDRDREIDRRRYGRDAATCQ